MTTPLAIVHRERTQFRDAQLFAKLCRWLRSDLGDARLTRLEHKGRQRIKLASSFVDIDASATQTAEEGQGIVAELLARAPVELREPLAQGRLLAPGDDDQCRPGLLLIAGPGQGKSTVTQYLAQRHRAVALQLIRDELAEDEAEALDELLAQPLAGPQLPAMHTCCMPARVVLPALSDWMQAHDIDASGAVLGFLRHLIAKANGDEQGPAPDDLRTLLGLVPWLFVFDGLDEITAAHEHEQALRAIEAFLELLRGCSARVLVVATTRPQTYSDQLARSFEVRHLLALSKERALAYAGVLLGLFFEDDREHREHVLRELEAVYSDTETQRLMESPLQVSIMTELVDEIGQPPRQRWRLFSEYQGLIIARERRRPAGKVLKDNIVYVEDILRHLGLLLQVMGESGGRAQALLTGDELEQLIAERLAGERFSEAKRDTLASELRAVAVNRLVFLVQVEKDRYGFELRPLQEFMAAAALTHGNEHHIEARLAAIAHSGAWRNVFLIAASKCFSSDGLYLRDVLVGLCERFNDPEVAPLSAQLRGGSALALAILQDGSVKGPQYEERLARLAVGLLAVPVHEEQLELGHVGGTVDRLLKEEFSERWPQEFDEGRGHLLVLAELCDRKVPWAMELIESRWPAERDEWLRVLDVARGWTDYANHWAFDRIDHSADVLTPKDIAVVFSRAVPLLATCRWAGHIFIHLRSEVNENSYPIGVSKVDFRPHPEHPRSQVKLQALLETENPAWQPYRAAWSFAVSPSKAALARALRIFARHGRREDDRWWTEFVPWPLAGLLAIAEDTDDLLQAASEVEDGRYGDASDWLADEQQWAGSEISWESFLDTYDHWPFHAAVVDSNILFNVAHAHEFPLLAYFTSKGKGHGSARSRRDRDYFAWREYQHRATDGADAPLPTCEFIELFEKGQVFWHPQATPWDLYLHLASRPLDEIVQIITGLSGRLSHTAWYFGWVAHHIAAKTWLDPLLDMLKADPARTDLLHVLAIVSPRVDLSLPDGVFAKTPPLEGNERVDYLALRLNCSTTVDEALAILEQLLQQTMTNELAFNVIVPAIHRALKKDIFSSPRAQGDLLARLRPWADRDRVIPAFQAKLTSRPTGLNNPANWYRLGLAPPAPPAPETQRPQAPSVTATTQPSPTTAHTLNAITLTNVRVFDQLELSLPPPTGDGQWLILVGENGVGKSTLLRTMVLALAEFEVAAQLVTNSRAAFVRGARREAKVGVELGGIARQRTISAERSGERLVEDTPNGPERPALFAYGCARGSASRGEDTDYTPVTDVRTLFDDREDLNPAKPWLVSLALNAKSHGGEAAQLYATVKATLVTLLDGVDELEVDGDGPWFSGPKVGERVPLASLSDGYITTIGWVIDLLARWVHRERQRGVTLTAGFNQTMRGIVFVDEIDLHLHPRWQLDVIARIRETFPRMTFVVTTHNPLTLLSARPGEIIVLERDEGGAVQARQRDLPPGIRADQVLTGEWFGLISTRDPQTLELLEEHTRHLRDHISPEDPRRKLVEAELRTRLSEYPGTTLDQLMRRGLAEALDGAYAPLDAEQRETAKRKLDELIRIHVHQSD